MRLKWLLIMGIMLMMAVPAFAQDGSHHVVRQERDTLFLLSRQYNVCLETLRDANPTLENFNEYDFIAVTEVIIPVAPPCYEIVTITTNNPGASMPELARAQNVCAEELVRNLEYSSQNEFKVYIPLDAPPCFNKMGERLTYYGEAGEWLDEPVYSTENVIPAPRDLQQSPYCAGDVLRANPQVNLVGYSEGMDLFLPDTVRTCKSTTPENSTLYRLSTTYNVCMEVIQSANFYFNAWDSYGGMTVQIPVDAPRCYDDAGKRLNRDDKEIYRTQSRESLFDVAEKHNVCLQDLRSANPFLYRGDVRLPEVLFIPNTPPCDNTSPVIHTVETGDTLQSLSMEYNVCFNRIIQANYEPRMSFEDDRRTTTVDQLAIGSKVSIPVARPDCYTLEWQNPLQMVDYVCYTEDFDLDKNYAGHEPPVSPTIGTESGFCHERSNTTPVIYQNEKLTVYKLRPLDTVVTVGQCFGVEANALMQANAVNFPWEVRPAGYWVIPEPYNHDCYLLTTDDQAYYAREQELGYKAGYLDENGVYTVNYQDTLSAIGHQFGYLPSSIAAANNLSDANVIYYRQELKMPAYPSLHIIGKVAAGAGVPAVLALVGYGIVRWRRGGKRKRKNDAAA